MTRAAQLLAVLCVVALVATASEAGGKKPPGGDDPNTGGGTIYFSTDQVWSMNSDGSEKTPLPVYEFEGFRYIEPSRQLHDGKRWFLQVWELDPSEGTYPDGRPLRELFAHCEDGLSTVQLTSGGIVDPADGSQLEPVEGQLRWTFDDRKVSWRGRRWQSGAVVEGGIYSLDISFSGPTPQPDGFPSLLVPTDLVYLDYGPGWVPNIWGHDWSPDGAWLVRDRFSGGPLFISIVDLSTGASEYLTEGWQPEWSPDGLSIAFFSGYGAGQGVETINIDGSDRKIIFANTQKAHGNRQSKWHTNPSWSPAASHLACARQYWSSMGWNFGDVMRAEADGDRETNLTNDLDAYAGLIGWR